MAGHSGEAPGDRTGQASVTSLQGLEWTALAASSCDLASLLHHGAAASLMSEGLHVGHLADSRAEMRDVGMGPRDTG